MRRSHLVAGAGITLVLATPIAAATALIPGPTDTPTPTPTASPTDTPTPTPTATTTPPPPGEPVWPPADSGGEWLPLPDEVYPRDTLEACGSTVSVAPGDVTSVEYLASRPTEGGALRVQYRGWASVDVTRESDGATLHELDVSGTGYELFTFTAGATTPATVTFSYNGPSLVGAFDAVEQGEFAERGLPQIFYYTEGNLTEVVTFGATEDDPIVSAEFLTDTVSDARDVCDMLDAVAEPTTPPEPEPTPTEPEPTPTEPEPTPTEPEPTPTEPEPTPTEP